MLKHVFKRMRLPCTASFPEEIVHVHCNCESYISLLLLVHTPRSVTSWKQTSSINARVKSTFYVIATQSHVSEPKQSKNEGQNIISQPLTLSSKTSEISSHL